MQTRKVKGRLFFFEKIAGLDKPLHNMDVELFDRDLVADDFLANGVTDLDGYFELEYDPSGAGFLDQPDLQLKVMYVKSLTYDHQGEVSFNHAVAACFNGPDNVTDPVFDFGDLHVPYWEYENPEEPGKVAFTPRVAVINDEVPQSQRFGMRVAQTLAYLRHLPTFKQHKLINKFDKDKPTLDYIEHYYPGNLTRRMEVREPGLSLSDGYFADLVLNGFNPCQLKKADNGEYYVAFKWDGYEQDGRHFAPNTTAFFTLEKDEFKVSRIVLCKRLHGEASSHARYREAKTYRPGDGEIWERVKRLFRINLFVYGEVSTHLGETHLNLEQYIVPIVRNVRKNPIAQLLAPHFYGTVAINKGANGLLITADGLVGSTAAVTPTSMGQLVRDAFAGYNWCGFKPRKVICSSHRFAIMGQMFWEVVCDYVAWFFAQHQAEIRANWVEIHRMSVELMAHSLPYMNQNDEQWYDTNEINTADKHHPTVDGVPLAITPLTHSDIASDADMANLKQMCNYLIFFSTYKHSWVNDSQYDIGGNIDFATLGVIHDITNLEIPSDKAVDPYDALNHPFITLFLSSVEYGYIMRNEDKDIHPQFSSRLAKIRDQFAAAAKTPYQDKPKTIKDIRSCINI